MTVIILSRVVTELGTVDDVTPRVIENLFVSDLAYLQDLYERVNERGLDAVDAVCPECGESFTVAVNSDGPGDADGDGDLAGTGGNGHASGATGASPEPEVESTPEDR
jgi:hypothetical protein